MITTTINNRLSMAISIHDALHRFGQVRGTGMATLEDKLAQQLAGIYQDPLFQIFMDMNKA